MYKTHYQIIDKMDSKKLSEFLSKEGQLLLPLVELVTRTEIALDEVIDVTGRAAIEAVLTLSAQEVAGAKHPGKKAGTIRWHGRQSTAVPLSDRKLRVDKPRLRRKGSGLGKEVEIPAYEAILENACLGRRILEILMMGVSTRNYQGVVPQMAEHGEIVVHVVRAEETLQAIYRLRHDAYLRKGYISSKPAGLMKDQWDEAATSIHLAALERGRITGAVRLVTDSAKGLPMERVFTNAVNRLRGQRRTLAEASTLVTSDAAVSDRRIWLELCRAVWREAEARQIDDLCVAVTGNHVAFYRRLLFESMGKGKRYHCLNGIMAYPLRLRVRDARTKHRLEGDRHAAPLRKLLLETRSPDSDGNE